MNDGFNNQGGFGGQNNSFSNGLNNQQPMMDQSMMNQGLMNQQMGMDSNMMQQQPLMNQGMQPGMVSGNFNKQSVPLKYKMANLFNFRNKNNMLILVPIAMVVIVLFVIIFSLLTTKTLKCSQSSTNELGLFKEVNTKVKYKFGHVNAFYEETTFDYTNSDIDNDTIEAAKKEIKNTIALSCKKSEGCTYNIKFKKKKIIYKLKIVYDKEARLELEDYYPTYSDYKKAFNDECNVQE